jgi:hypothetical protein
VGGEGYHETHADEPFARGPKSVGRIKATIQEGHHSAVKYATRLHGKKHQS